MVTPTLIKKLRQHPVIKAVYQVAQQVESPIYLVGGTVRDLLMGILPEKDFDFVTQDNLVKVARLFSRIVSGSLIQWSSVPPHYRVIFYLNSNRTEVDFSDFQGDDLYQDLVNRDFTVNAMAIMTNELFQGESLKLYDPMGGEKDLQRKVIRITSPQSFDKDPLRILRAIRIAKARNLTIDSKTKEEIYRHKDRLFFSAVERIRSEFFKIISFSGARDSLKFLEELGLLSFLLPETEDLKNQNRGEPNGLSRWEHSLETVKWCEWVLDYPEKLFPEFQSNLKEHFSEEIEKGVERHSLLKLGGLLLECEKSIQKNNITRKITQRFKLGNQANRILRKLVKYHAQALRLFQQEKMNIRVYFRFFRDFGPEGLDMLVISWADFIANVPERFESSLDLKLRKLIYSLTNYYFKDYILTSPQPLLSGRDIIARFDLKEGKIIGDLLSQVAEAEAEGLISSRKEALLYIEKLIKKLEVFKTTHK